jgi:hypothetical protein
MQNAVSKQQYWKILFGCPGLAAEQHLCAVHRRAVVTFSGTVRRVQTCRTEHHSVPTFGLSVGRSVGRSMCDSDDCKRG